MNEPPVIVEFLHTSIWIESDMMGGRSVMLQHQGCDPFEYARFGYDYRYTSNAGTLEAAEALARQLGAIGTIEHRSREMKFPTPDEVREDIKQMQDYLATLEPAKGGDR
jgi:hypothetical protein